MISKFSFATVALHAVLATLLKMLPHFGASLPGSHDTVMVSFMVKSGLTPITTTAHVRRCVGV